MRLTFWPFIAEAGSLQPNRHSGSAASDGLTVCLNSETVEVVCSQPPTDTISERGSVTGTGPSTSERLLAHACPPTLCKPQTPQIKSDRRAFRSVWRRKSGPLFDFAATLTLTCTLNPRGAWAEKIHHTETHTSERDGTGIGPGVLELPLLTLLEPVPDGFTTF